MRNVLFALMFVAMNASAQEVTDSTIFKELNIDEVTITASRIQQKVNGYVVNLKGEELVKGKNVEEVLSFLPRMEYSGDKLKIDGVPVSEIYLNGVRMADANMLKNILGEQIKNVEVQYTAGVNQKSSTSGGVVHINLRQPANGGYYGSVSARHKLAPENWNAGSSLGGMVYWGNKHWGVYTNGGISNSRYKDKYEESFGSSWEDISSITRARLLSKGKSIYDNVGGSYKLNDRHTIIGNLYVSRGLNNAASSLQELLPAPTDLTYLHSNGNNTYTDAIARYAGQLDSLGTQLMITAEQVFSYMNSESRFSILQYGSNIVNRSNISKLEVNLQRPVGKTLMLEFGGSIDYTHFSYRDCTPLDKKIAGAKNDANINATTPLLFVNISGMYRRLRYMVGSNYQHNFIHYRDLETQIISKNHQWSFNPQVNVEINLNQKYGINWRLGYQHRMGDIPFGDINASMTWENDHLYAIGTPDLKAWTSNNFLTAFSFWQNKLTISGIYSKGHNYVQYETIEDPNHPGIYMTRPVNRANDDVTAGLNLNVNFKPVKMWHMNMSVSCVWDRLDNTLGGIYYEGWKHRCSVNMNNSFSITETLQLTLNGQYEPTSYVYGQKLFGVHQLNGSLSKQLGKHWQVNLTGTAIRKPRTWSETSLNAYRYHDTQREDRYLQIGITYRFDNGKSTRHRTINNRIINVGGSTRQK